MKGMTNAQKDTSDLATKSELSAKADVSALNSTNATVATKANQSDLTALQNGVAPAFKEVSVGADGKSLDFTALNGQVNNVAIPSSGGSEITVINQTYNYTSFSELLGLFESMGSSTTAYIIGSITWTWGDPYSSTDKASIAQLSSLLLFNNSNSKEVRSYSGLTTQIDNELRSCTIRNIYQTYRNNSLNALFSYFSTYNTTTSTEIKNVTAKYKLEIHGIMIKTN